MSRQEWRPLYSSIYSTCNNLQKLEWQLLKETPFTVQTCFSKKMTATFHKDIKSWLKKNILHQLKFEHLYKIKHFKYHIFFHKETGQQTGQIHILTEKKKVKVSVFEPWVSKDWGFTPIAIIVKQLLACIDVSGGDQDQVRRSIDGVKPRLAVSSFTVVDQPTEPTRFLCGINTVIHRHDCHNTRQVSILKSQLLNFCF